MFDAGRARLGLFPDPFRFLYTHTRPPIETKQVKALLAKEGQPLVGVINNAGLLQVRKTSPPPYLATAIRVSAPDPSTNHQPHPTPHTSATPPKTRTPPWSTTTWRRCGPCSR